MALLLTGIAAVWMAAISIWLWSQYQAARMGWVVASNQRDQLISLVLAIARELEENDLTLELNDNNIAEDLKLRLVE